MQDLEKSGEVKFWLDAIKTAADSYEDDIHPIYFDYDGVIGLLEQARTLVTESARCPRPDDLPPELPWCERLAGDGTVFNPYVYDGTMSYEDFQMAVAAASYESDLLDDESEDMEI